MLLLGHMCDVCCNVTDDVSSHDHASTNDRLPFDHCTTFVFEAQCTTASKR